MFRTISKVFQPFLDELYSIIYIEMIPVSMLLTLTLLVTTEIIVQNIWNLCTFLARV